MTTPTLSRLWQRTLQAVSPAPSLRRAPSRPTSPAVDRCARQLASQLNLHPSEITRQPTTPAPTYAVVLRRDGLCAEVVFSADFLQVHLVGLRADAAALLAADTVIDLLQANGIHHLDEVAIAAAVLEAEQHKGRILWASVARGRPAAPGVDESLDYAFDLKAAQAHFAAIGGDLARLTDRGPAAVWAAPGQVLARRGAASTGRPGEDIFGRPLEVTPGKPASLRAGLGVDQTETSFCATAYGYVCLQGAELSVRPPLLFADEDLEARFAYIPSLDGTGPDADQLRDLADHSGICDGLVDDSVDAIVALFASQAPIPRCVVLAKGRPPVHGRDAELAMAMDCDPKPGRLLPDGRFDFRETHFGLNVRQGALLATLRPATQGQDGCTVRGEVLPARDGVDCSLSAGANVKTTEEDGVLRFTATHEGRIRRQGDQLHVYETLSIDGDVDYDSGHIDFPGDVFISGSVLPEFEVRARGSIAVRQQVENGARLEAGGDILIGGGIVGADTRLDSGGQVQARFVHSARVRSRGDIEVGSYLIKGDVSCGGRVVVRAQGGPKGGLVAGGHIVAADGLEARFAGSANGMPTQLILGVDPQVEEAIADCLRALETCRQRREQCQRLLGLSDIDLPTLRRVLQQAAPGRRRQLAVCIRQWHQLGQRLTKLSARHSDLLEKRLRPQARLAVSGVVHPGVFVRLGEHTALFQTPLASADLSRDNWTETLLLSSAA